MKYNLMYLTRYASTKKVQLYDAGWHQSFMNRGSLTTWGKNLHESEQCLVTEHVAVNCVNGNM